MGLLENAISQELGPSPSPSPPPSPGSSGSDRKLRRELNSINSSMTTTTNTRAKTQERHKVAAAAVGATLTSLTMTPFDVLKTRLQTQPEQSFIPSSRLIRSQRHSTTPWPPPIPSTSKSTNSTPSSTIDCCTKTYFSSNSDKSLSCRFNPKSSTVSLPPPTTTTMIPQQTTLHLSSFHSNLINGSLNHGSTTIATSPSCLYPTLSEATTPHHNSATSTSTRMTINNQRHFNGFWDAIVKITKHEGVGALWRGTGPALVMSVPGQIVYMVGYDWGRRNLLNHAPNWAYNNNETNSEQTLSKSYLTSVPLVAGSLSRTVVAILTSPLELVRTRIQSSSTNLNVFDIVYSLKQQGQMSSWFKGLTPTLLRDVPFSGIYWTMYETFKKTLTGGKGLGEGWETQSVSSEFGIAFVSGSLSGMIAASLTNPFDVVKTRRQALDQQQQGRGGGSSTTKNMTRFHSQNSTPIKTFPLLIDIFKREGFKGLMSGLTPRLAKIGPACGIMIASYEGLALVLDKRDTN
ncbi:Carrier protein, mitochondrial [Microbotryomycetes sp. JL221]|nr:Carrier protein, mitochondrial [Microbotryomycetes sp. JL221]